MLEVAEIKRMSMTERLQAMELLWSSIASAPEDLQSPSWHGDVLAKRLAKVKAGRGHFLTITKLKERLGKRNA